MVLAASNSTLPIPPMLALRIFNEVTDAIKQLKKVIGELIRNAENRKVIPCQLAERCSGQGERFTRLASIVHRFCCLHTLC
jgi:hypothetical protein